MDQSHQGNPPTISESKTIEDYGRSLNLHHRDLDIFREVLIATHINDIRIMHSLGITPLEIIELADISILLRKLLNTGFLPGYELERK